MHLNLKKQAMTCLFLTLHGQFSWFCGKHKFSEKQTGFMIYPEALRNPSVLVINFVVEICLSYG